MFGKRSQILKDRIDTFNQDSKKKILVISTCHLGYQSLNQIETDIDGKEINENNYLIAEERTKARLKVVANKIIKDLKYKEDI